VKRQSLGGQSPRAVELSGSLWQRAIVDQIDIRLHGEDRTIDMIERERQATAPTELN